jgi:hypothetical protein
MSIRPEVRQLLDLGPLPDGSRVAKSRERLERSQRLIETIEMPVSNEEAEALATLFGPDDCFDPVPNGEMTLTIPPRPPYAATAEEGRQERIVG